MGTDTGVPAAPEAAALGTADRPPTPALAVPAGLADPPPTGPAEDPESTDGEDVRLAGDEPPGTAGLAGVERPEPGAAAPSPSRLEAQRDTSS
ncbi:hypothetical protein HC031_13350 [Planosporangium thailandense]|uniref:Uncharacterized protein n=1 Tax=Planosporangium thailandense TaxID=765197 RepID=A0ABX0XZM7_9ACTN|nr:hypothetical protein [Planosporangium thailandense]NJC70692.1 hypothetical protein [Planosporangium thailandense]